MNKVDKVLQTIAILVMFAVISWGFAKLEHLGYSQAELEYQRAAINAGAAEMRVDDNGVSEFVWFEKRTIKAKNADQKSEVR